MIIATKEMKAANLITHGGVFHADEVVATVILEKALQEDISVCRCFKVPETLNPNTIVYDIGQGMFDHHQKGGNGTRENGVPYAAAGLIWREFGYSVVSKYYSSKSVSSLKLVWELIDRDFIQGIDAVDNGEMPKADYPAQAMNFSKMVSMFNPKWTDTKSPDEAFIEAVDFAKIVFDKVMADAVAKAKAQQIVDEAIDKAEEQIMVLDQFVPWQEFVFSSANKKAEEILFVVFPSARGGYNWQCVPDCLSGTGQRKPVPADWRGLRENEIQEVTGVSTATFCHPAGFIGGAERLEDAIQLAKNAIKA